MGVVTHGEKEIRIKADAKPVCYRPYRLSLKEREIVRDKVDDLLNAGIVRESDSSFASPVVLVSKKDGSHKLCVDYRALNKITDKDVYPMPIIENSWEI